MRAAWFGLACALSACGFDQLGSLPVDAAAADAADASTSADAAPDANDITLDATAPVRDEVIAVYTFQDAPSSVVRDVSGVAPALDLTIEAGGSTRWDATGLTLFGEGGRLTTSGGASKISKACKANNVLSVEAWVQPTVAAQGGPVRIATVSNGANARNFTLGVGENNGGSSSRYLLRLGTRDEANWSIATPSGTTLTSMQHVVATAKFPGVARTYVDGVERASMALPSDFSRWAEDFPLVLGGEVNENDRRFLGTYALVAIYCRELSPQEVARYHAAGPPRR